MGCSCLSKGAKLQKPQFVSQAPAPEAKQPDPVSVFAVQSGNKLMEFNYESGLLVSSELSVSMLPEAGVTGIGDNVMFAGGVERYNEEVATCYLVKTKDATAVLVTALPLPRRRLRLCYDHKDLVYAVGGVRETINKSGITLDYTHSFTKFSFTSNVWTDLPDLAVPVESPAVCYHQDIIYAFGGIQSSNQECLDTVQHYSFMSESWSVSEVYLPEPLHSLMAVSVEGQVIVFGGLDDHDTPSHKSYTFSKNKFKNAGALPVDISPVFPFYAMVVNRRVLTFNEDLKVLSWDEGEWVTKC